MSSVLGQRLAQLRKQHKISGQKLANIVGCTQAYISYIENSDMPSPNVDLLQKIAKVFDVSTDYLLGKTDHLHNSSPGFAAMLNNFIGGSSVTLEELAERANVFSSDLARYASGEIEPSDGKMHVILEAMKSMGWKPKMAGDVQKEDDTVPVFDQEHQTVHGEASNVQQIIPSEHFRFIPVVSLKPCAGRGNAYADFNWYVEDLYPVRNVDVLGHSWQGGDFKMAVIEGSSMEPKYHNGDYVLFVVGENYGDGDIVVASWCGKLYIRGFFSNSNGVELRPRAQGYETIFVPKGDERLQIFGKVLRSYPQPRKELGFYN